MSQKENKISKKKNMSLDFDSLIRDILRQWWVIILAGVAAAFLYGTYARITYQPLYTCSTTFIVSAQDDGSFSSANNNKTAAENLVSSFETIARSDILSGRVCDRLHISRLDAAVSLANVESTNLVTLTVQAHQPKHTYEVTQAVFDLTQDLLAEVSGSVYARVIKEAEYPAYETNPLSYQGDMYKAGVLGALFIILLILIQSYSRDTIKNENDFRNKVDSRLIETVHHEKKKGLGRKKKALLLNSQNVSFDYVETIRMAATKIRKEMDKSGYKAVMVTSASENEGKSTIGANIALALAQENWKVAILDLDLRNPSQYKIWRIPADGKESDYYRAIKKGEELQAVSIIRNKILHGFFTYKSHGGRAINKTVSYMEHVIHRLKESYDYIVIDTAPMGLVAETSMIARYADCSVLVLTQDLVYARQINDTIDHLNDSQTPVLGCIYNNVKYGFFNRNITGYGYGKAGYGYGYGRYGYGRYGYGYGRYGYGRYGYGRYGYGRKGSRKKQGLEDMTDFGLVSMELETDLEDETEIEFETGIEFETEVEEGFSDSMERGKVNESHREYRSV